MRIGLALGAGGPFGWAFHLGVAEGVAAALGVGVRDTETVVGTSAGGAVAASLFSGATTEEVLDAIARPLSEEEREEMRQIKQELSRRPLHRLRPQEPSMVRLGGAVGLAGLLPAGPFPTFPLRRFPTTGLDHWPAGLWITAVRLGDGQTIVFGRDRTDVSVSDALEATSAVPGMFQPKQIGKDRYIDGAVASATHAGLFADHDLDVAVIASPMTRPGRGLIRERARRQLDQEKRLLERTGTKVIVVEPNGDIVARAAGFPRKSPEVAIDIVSEVRAEVAQLLNDAGSGGGNLGRPARLRSGSA